MNRPLLQIFRDSKMHTIHYFENLYWSDHLRALSLEGTWRECGGLWAVSCGLWAVGCGLWAVSCGLWAVSCGLWAAWTTVRLSRSRQWPRRLRRRSTTARLLRLWVRIPPGAWMSVCCECCVLSGRGLCDELITRPEESYRLWCVVVCDLETSWLRKPWPIKRF